MIQKTQESVNYWDAFLQPWADSSSIYWHSVYEQALDRLTQFPLLGLNRGFMLKFMQAFEAWAKLYPTSLAYQKLLTEIQIQAIEELILTLLATKAQKPINDWAQLCQLWSSTADRVFEAAFLAEDNLRTKGSFLNALNQYRLCQQELVEVWLNLMNLPTRSEVDEIHKNIYELRKEVRRLKQVLASQEPHVSDLLPAPEFLQDRTNAV